MKVSSYLLWCGERVLDKASILRKHIMAELRGEQILTSSELNQMTIEIGAVLEKYGYPPQYNESYNCLRLAIGKDYFGDWLGIPSEEDAYSHVSWSQLREKYAVKAPPAQALTWLRGKLPF